MEHLVYMLYCRVITNMIGVAMPAPDNIKGTLSAMNGFYPLSEHRAEEQDLGKSGAGH